MAINLDNYEMVKDRLPLFYEKYPDGRITSEVISEDSTGVTIRAFLWKDMDEQAHNTPLTTGIAREVPGGFIDKYTENCETSSIGRALANLNMYSKDRPSREEMESAQSMQAQKEQAPPKKAPVKQAPVQTQAPDHVPDAGDEYDYCPSHDDTWSVNPNSNFTWESGEPQASHQVYDQDGEAVTNTYNGKTSNVYCNQPNATMTNSEFFRIRHGWVAGTGHKVEILPSLIGTDNIDNWLKENGHGENWGPAAFAIMDAIKSRKG